MLYVEPSFVVAGPNAADHEGTLQTYEKGFDTRAAFIQRWEKDADGTWRITRWELKPGVSTRYK